MLSANHFIHSFRNLNSTEYMKNEFKIQQFFQEIIKNAVLFEKSDSIQPLLKAMNSVIKGESVYLKNFSFVSGNWINRM